MKRGVPPTALNARTGEFTPPGVTARARSNQASLAAVVEGIVAEVTRSLSRRCAKGSHSVRAERPGLWVGAQVSGA
jgi:hypothetical protein